MLKIDKRKVFMILAERDMTLSELAARMGMKPNNLSVLLSRDGCRPATAKRLADALGVSVSAVLED